MEHGWPIKWPIDDISKKKSITETYQGMSERHEFAEIEEVLIIIGTVQ